MFNFKNVVLISISTVMGFVLAFSISAIDSFHIVPFAGLVISMAWLSLFAMANGWMDLEFYEKRGR
jgi:hypothetical protein